MKRIIRCLALASVLAASILAAGCKKEAFEINRGINIAHWLSQSEARGAERESYFGEKDIEYIASLGFDHIRIPVDEEQMFDESGNKEPEAFALLHKAVGCAIDNGLRVIVDLHILRSHYFNADVKPLFTEESAQEAFYECWRKISGELSDYPVSHVAYELMNEPVADDPEVWNDIVGKCYEAVRELEPERVIVIGSNRWQSFDTVKDLRVPQNDPNIIISFHYYNPFLLTHYEASWTEQKDYHGPVHYPGTMTTSDEITASIEGLAGAGSFGRQALRTTPEGASAVMQYAGRTHDIETIRKDFSEVVEAAGRLGLRVYCGEYGCLNSAPTADRMRWHKDMETVFDEFGIARALWCYNEGNIGFGIIKSGKGPDESLINVLFGKDPCKASRPLDIKMGDPYILLASDGNYYMYGTTDGDNGFSAYKSADLKDWSPVGVVYEGHKENSWTTDCFWAPEVYERDGKYYMLFSSNTKENPNNDLEVFRIGVAVSDSPEGPFEDMYDRPIFDPGYPIIDGDVFFDEDGRCYLYYSRCCYKHAVESEVSKWARENGLFDEIEESWVYGVELKPDFSGVIGEPQLMLCPPATMSDAQSEWESRSVTCGEANRRWTEGSFLIKKDGIYYMMYSANFFGGENYAIGYATATSPLGPYTKSPDNPLLQKNTEEGGDITGVGHNSITYSKDGKKMYCVYHGRTYSTGEERVVFISEIEAGDGHLRITER